MKVKQMFTAHPAITGMCAIAVAVASIAGAAFAWGPERPTYTINKPSDHVTFNSITDNPDEGDERNFVRIKSTENTSANGWQDDITVKNNQEYWVRMYVHNNAAANLNLVAENVTAKFNVPTQTANRVQVDGYLSSSNATPTEVWDQAVFHGANNSTFNLSYVTGSASYTNNAVPAGMALSDSIVSSGAKLGYKTLDGKIPGCFQYSGIVLFKVKAHTTDISLEKTVRLNGDKDFTKDVTAKAGQKVDYQIHFTNNGGVVQKDVVIKDILPKGVTYDAGTSYIHNANGTKQIADGITAGGAIIGDYSPTADAYLKFTATINDKDLVCGENKLVNTAKATVETGSTEDTATVTVNKDCAPKTVEACNLDTKKIETVSESKIDDVHYSKDLSKCKETPPTPETVEACNLNTKQIETVETSKIDDVNYTKDLSKCAETPTPAETVEVCNTETGTIDTVEKTASNDSKYTTDTSKCASKEETTPTELPHTGIATSVTSLFGAGIMSYAGYAYIASRRR